MRQIKRETFRSQIHSPNACNRQGRLSQTRVLGVNLGLTRIGQGPTLKQVSAASKSAYLQETCCKLINRFRSMTLNLSSSALMMKTSSTKNTLLIILSHLVTTLKQINFIKWTDTDQYKVQSNRRKLCFPRKVIFPKTHLSCCQGTQRGERTSQRLVPRVTLRETKGIYFRVQDQGLIKVTLSSLQGLHMEHQNCYGMLCEQAYSIKLFYHDLTAEWTETDFMEFFYRVQLQAVLIPST